MNKILFNPPIKLTKDQLSDISGKCIVGTNSEGLLTDIQSDSIETMAVITDTLYCYEGIDDYFNAQSCLVKSDGVNANLD